MIVAELRELLAGDEEGGLAVRQSFARLWQLQRGCADSFQRSAHRLTNSRNTLG